LPVASIAGGAVYNDLLFYADFSGFLHYLDRKTGKLTFLNKVDSKGEMPTIQSRFALTDSKSVAAKVPRAERLTHIL
jgi:hypothetical protein